MPIEQRGAAQRVTAATITYRTTKYEYDEVGNQTKVITPRGVETDGRPERLRHGVTVTTR